MKEEEIHLLIVRYLKNQTNSVENEFLTEWIGASKENETEFFQIKAVWEADKLKKPDRESLLALKKVHERLDFKDSRVSEKLVGPNLRRYFLAAACAVIILVLSVIAIVRFYPAHKQEFNEYTTKAGEKIKLELPDGTQVSLAPGSTLKYPTEFDGKTREVLLEGEAFFSVAKNPAKPFKVHYGSWTTTVLGTKFNVSAFADSKEISVSLLEGSVKVNNKERRYRLKPGEQLLFDKVENATYLRGFDEEEVTGWMQNKLVFRNIKLSEAAAQIERMYGIEIIFSDKSTSGQHIHATFNNKPLHIVLDAIRSTGNVDYRREGNIIYLTEKD